MRLEKVLPLQLVLYPGNYYLDRVLGLLNVPFIVLVDENLMILVQIPCVAAVLDGFTGRLMSCTFTITVYLVLFTDIPHVSRYAGV